MGFRVLFGISAASGSTYEDARLFSQTGLEDRPPPPSLHQHRHFYQLEDTSSLQQQQPRNSTTGGLNNVVDQDPSKNNSMVSLQTVKKRFACGMQ